jgi:hypothetical protein
MCPLCLETGQTCARQESNLLPCGPEMGNPPFGLSSVNSRNAAECRLMSPLSGQIAVNESIRPYQRRW